ncbi:unnamed protein product [Cladocopium goreaui]|uniref:Blue-light photoreceptor n=1 Tax=Cladocopium goreaui TaxID=2562237 RepID=A0A9P1GN15_9DINO|nr:unnamed protein product [Cladocopium goreaui]
MPPKADAKAKAKAKGKAAAARRPSQAKVQKPGSKKGANVPVEIEIKATLDSALNKGDAPMRVGGIEVTGQHRLSRILVESIVALPFVRGFSKVCLRRISYYPKSPERLGPAPSLSLSPASARSARTKPQSEAIQFIQVEETRAEEVDCPSLFLALCLGIEASKPQLIRVGPAELLAEEARELQKYQDAYGISSAQVQQLPEVVNTRHKHSLMVIPLAGGRCLLPPLSEAAVEDINSFTKIFNDAISATDGPDSAGFISLALQGTQHVCCSVLLQPMLRGCTEELINLTQVFTNLEDIMLGKTHPELSVDYYDGLGANAIGVEKEQIDDFRGGPTSDGVPINELNKMVFDLVPGMKQTRPTEFLAWFHSQMQQSGTFWNLKAIYSTTSAAIDFDAVLQDADGHAFLAPCSCNAQFAQLATLRQNADAALDWKYRHVFSRMARWMLSGLLLHSPIQGPGDLKWLRELCMILAGMPEDLSLSLPPPPDAAPLHLRFAWSFVRRCVRCLRWHNPMMVNGKLVHLPQPGLQMVWALLDAAIELVPDEHTKSYPERKRLALWASLCFAIRLAVACKKMDETGWLADRSKLWGRFDDGIDLEGLAAQVYVTRFGVQESWSRDPVSKETRSVFLDDLPWEVIPLVDTEEDVKTEYPEDLEDPEASVAPWAETVSAAEQAAVLKANAQELDAAQTALKDLEPSMGRQVRKAWESAKRVVVTGGIGQGKRAISKNAMADLTLAELCTEVYRFPVRLKLADLQNRKDCADVTPAAEGGMRP